MHSHSTRAGGSALSMRLSHAIGASGKLILRTSPTLAPGTAARLVRANRAALGPFAAYLETQWSEQLDQLAALAEATESEANETQGGGTNP